MDSTKSIYFILLLITLIKMQALGQETKSASLGPLGNISGIAYDSVYRYTLKVATVAIYSPESTTDPICFGLTDNLGRFSFNNIPVGRRLKLVVSYTGYINVIRHFLINKENLYLSFDRINMAQESKELQEVIVTYVPPLRWNNDTLEFNPNAFMMEKNAVVEDLLRKVPGVILWGDGTITVNGREVKSVLVDGKPFFGGSTKVAIQNIPKDAVDKVQVYQQSISSLNEIDSITQVNIRLKADSKKGNFGKLSAGYGSGHRYDADASLNFFTPKTQWSAVAANNNINKVATTAKGLLDRSTYKGQSSTFDYQPDFRMAGISQPLLGSLSFQRDFVEKPDNFTLDRLSVDYFFRRNRTDIKSNTNTITALQGDTLLNQPTESTNNYLGIQQSLNAKYQRKKNTKQFEVDFTLTDNRIQSDASTANAVLDKFNQLRSQNQLLISGITNTTEALINGNFTKAVFNNNRAPVLRINYQISVNQTSIDQYYKNSFESFGGSLQAQKIDRNYVNGKSGFGGQINISWDNLLPVHLRNLELVSIGIGTDIGFQNIHQENKVFNFDTSSKIYKPDDYLSFRRDYLQTDIKPFMSLRRIFSQNLTNRYAHIFELSGLIKGEIFKQENRSNHNFQSINRQYDRWIPEATIKYSDFSYGRSHDIYSVRYAVSYAFPTIEQMAPFIDSVTIYDINFGNFFLQPSRRNELVANFTHSTLRPKAGVNYEVAIKTGFVNSYISDSVKINLNGLRKHYPINVNGFQYAGINGRLSKRIPFTKNSGVQLIINQASEIYKRPGYLNGIFYSAFGVQHNSDLDAYFSFGEYFDINIGQTFFINRSKQLAVNNLILENIQSRTRINVNAAFTSKLQAGSNISFNTNKSTGAKQVNFAIWNANVSYRFFRQNNGEIKFAVYDLLHQNSNIINYNYDISQTTGTNNVLQQYYMLSFSFYPRTFGNKLK